MTKEKLRAHHNFVCPFHQLLVHNVYMHVLPLYTYISVVDIPYLIMYVSVKMVYVHFNAVKRCKTPKATDYIWAAWSDVKAFNKSTMHGNN